MRNLKSSCGLLNKKLALIPPLLLVCLLGVLLLGGCSSSQSGSPMTDNRTVSEAFSSQEHEMGERFASQGGSPIANERTVSEAFSSQEREVWFEINGPIGKDTLITAVYVVQNGTISVYDVNNGYGAATMSLGDASKCGSEDVADAIIEQYKRDLNSDESSKHEESKGSYLKRGDDVLYSIRAYEEDLDSGESIRREGFEGNYLENGASTFVLNTDQTGNAVVSESVVVSDASSGKCNVMTLTGGASGQIYDSIWSGFAKEYTSDMDILSELSSLPGSSEDWHGLTAGIYLLQLNPDRTTVFNQIGDADIEVL